MVLNGGAVKAADGAGATSAKGGVGYGAGGGGSGSDATAGIPSGGRGADGLVYVEW